MRQDLTSDSVSRHIDASPDELYDIVSDVTRTPELSSEIADVKWLDGATGPAVGARFKARNSAGRGPDWYNKPVITVADRGREFTFERTEWIGGTLRWSYRFDPDATGTMVTESYEVTKQLNSFGWFLIGTLYGLKDRKADLRQGMTETLERLAALVREPA